MLLGWGREGRIKGEGMCIYMYVIMTDLHCSTTETSTAV